MREITKDTIVGDLLNAHPAAEAVFAQFNMHCRACSSALGETIEQACAIHGVNIDQMITALQVYKN